MNIQYNEKKVNPMSLSTEFSAKNLTPYGGMILFGKFFEVLGIRKWVEENIKIEKKRKSGYEIPDLFLGLLHLILSGIERISHAEVFKTDEAYKQIIGVTKIASYVTFWRFLRKFNMRNIVMIRRMNEFLLSSLCSIKKYTEWILDFDLSVYPVFGKHKRATVGYNPKRKGAPSYYPMFCSIRNIKFILHAKFRGGTTPSTSEVIEFLRDSINKALRYVGIIKLRLDSEFYRRDVIEFLDKERHAYVVVADITRGIQVRLEGLEYKDIGDNLEVASFYFRPFNWEKEYKFVVRRRKLQDFVTKQGTLFVLNSYAYRVLTTNIEDTPNEDIWRFYDKHADVENVIKESKAEFRACHLPSTKYLVNLTYFWIVILAYNLFIAFKELCMPRGLKNISMETMRLKYIVIAAKLIRTGRKLILQLSKLYPYKKEFKEIERNILYYFSSG